MSRLERIQNSVNEHLSQIQKMELVDESQFHAGRAGTESHFKLLIVRDDFCGKSRVQRQRDIQSLLKPEFDLGLHALSMRLLTTQEAEAQNISFETPNCAGSK